MQCELFEKYGFKSNDEKKLLVRKADDICCKLIEDNLNNNKNVICDKYLRNDSFFEGVVSLKNIKTIIVYLTADSELILKRYNGRKRDERPLPMDVINVYPVVDGVTKTWPSMTLDKIKDMSYAHDSFIDSLNDFSIIKVNATSLSVKEIVEILLKNEVFHG